MNILREVRRVRNKSMPVRIMLLLAFCVIFVVTTYAWFSTQRNVTMEGLYGETTPWDVSYYIKADEDEDETLVLDETVTFTVDEFYPGMPSREDVVNIYNLGGASTVIDYELISVKVFGQEILTEDASGNQFLNVYEKDEDGENVLAGTVAITTNTTTDGTTTTVFSGDTAYPFVITYTYDKTKLIGEYVEGAENSDRAHATFHYNMSWDYEGTEAKDILDTQFGKDAYTYYDAGYDTQKALEVMVRITSSMVHPSVDPDHPDYEGQ